MSGPTAGRLIQAEIGERFASANLPMLHTRHLHDDDADQFRPGVEQGDEVIDLADEFERQFFGDLMLTGLRWITGEWSSGQAFTLERVSKAIKETERELLGLYEEKHRDVQHRNARLKQRLKNPQYWWHDHPQAAGALSSVQRFMHNIDVNFGADSNAYQQIQDQQHREQHKQQIIRALLAYRKSRDAWDQLFSDS
jgi:hypothetical protein